MRELNDHWVLPVARSTVIRCCIDRGVTIELAGKSIAQATILIGSVFELRTESGSWRLDPGDEAVGLAPILGLIGEEVVNAEAYKDGTLRVAFRDGSRLSVPPDVAFEAWEFIGPHGAKVVALPGGELAIWRSAA